MTQPYTRTPEILAKMKEATTRSWIPRRKREVLCKIGPGCPLDCWLWLGNLDIYGYGKYGNRGAHKVVYEMLVGPVLEGLQLDHLCRNHACVNPSHLEQVTVGENIRRGHAARGTARSGEWARRKNQINNAYYHRKKEK